MDVTRVIPDAKFERQPSGHILVVDPDSNQQVEVAVTLQCCHCGGHFVSVRGSGVTRGFCLRCRTVTCGAQKCDQCYPFEQQLADVEAGKRRALR